MKRCVRCHMPDTRPGSRFVAGVCGACRNFDKRAEIDWKEREAQLDEILDGYRGSGQYDVLCPVSGGKDSHRIVHEMVNRGMRPLLLTVTDSFTHTQAGTHNLRNLITKFNLNHLTYTISHDLFVRATRHAFEKTGEALKFVEYAIYTIPYKIAQAMGIGLVTFGENSAYEYGSVEENSSEATPVIHAMIDAMVGQIPFWHEGGISGEEVLSLTAPKLETPRVIYMSYFFPWSSMDNLAIARRYGFKDLSGEWKRDGTIEDFEQIDSMAYMVHLWLKYPKFGFQRVSDIASRRVREGYLTLDEAKKRIADYDSRLDRKALKDFCQTLGYTEAEFWRIVYTSGWATHEQRRGVDGNG